MATITSYAGYDLYTQGRQYNESAHRRGDRLEIWVKQLGYLADKPTAGTISVDTAASTGDETISVTSDINETIYRRDVLAFFDGGSIVTLAVVKETTAVSGTATSLPVLPLNADLTTSATAQTYFMRPLLSVQSGGTIETSSSTFTQRNRHTGLTLARAKSEVSETGSTSGAIVGSGRTTTDKPHIDPGLAEVEAAKSNDFRLWYQVRYAPYDDAGVGTGQQEAKILITGFTPSSDPDNFMSLDISFEVDGISQPYLPLGMTNSDVDTLLTS